MADVGGKLDAALQQRQELGDRIRAARKARGMTVDKLAKAAGISSGFLSEVERGLSSISSEKLALIAKALSMRLADLIEGTNSGVEGANMVIPSALNEAAQQLDLTYAQTIRLLKGYSSLVARRSGDDDDGEWTVDEWVRFYHKVKDFM